MKLADRGSHDVRAALAATGLVLRIPPVRVRVRSPIAGFAARLADLYGEYELHDTRDYADIDIRMLPGARLRRWVRPTVQFVVDGVTPFEPFRLDHAMPMFEWGLNWVFAHRMHQFLLLHSAVVERDGRALLLPAWPGSGKSTLAASLACAGWRYLSDEFGVVAASGMVHPFARPAALKNESIAVIERMRPGGVGPVYPATRKGAVAHFRVPPASLARAADPAPIAAVVFPDFIAGAPLTVQPMTPAVAFLKLAHNAFNYEVVGERGFRAVAGIVRSAPCRIVRYGDLAAAHGAIADIVAGAA
ncbi:MAG TPA: HprK-related kinase A [Casimicrobiaceae bacterium]|nr:HprK-related kinase A [Casimicrobiaceae bacterium]